MIKIFNCDWKENPNEVIDNLSELLKDFGIVITEINTKSDFLSYSIADKNKESDFYESYFPELGTIRWQGELPEWIDTEQGLIHKDTLRKMVGTRLWEKRAEGLWVLSDRHA